jgi:hypothetical protein
MYLFNISIISLPKQIKLGFKPNTTKKNIIVYKLHLIKVIYFIKLLRNKKKTFYINTYKKK